jgi:hypothetical protein
MTTEPLGDRPAGLNCSRCGLALERGRGECYFVELRAVADPSPPVFHPEDLEGDTERSIGELLDRLRKLSERQLIDQVYRRRLFCLCAPCYAEWVADPFARPGRSSR